MTARQPLTYGLAELVDMLGLSKSTIYVLMDKREFPRPRQMTPRTARWDADEVREWVKSRPHKGGAS